jgi:hypothetical protein
VSRPSLQLGRARKNPVGAEGQAVEADARPVAEGVTHGGTGRDEGSPTDRLRTERTVRAASWSCGNESDRSPRHTRPSSRRHPPTRTPVTSLASSSRDHTIRHFISLAYPHSPDFPDLFRKGEVRPARRYPESRLIPVVIRVPPHTLERFTLGLRTNHTNPKRPLGSDRRPSPSGRFGLV